MGSSQIKGKWEVEAKRIPPPIGKKAASTGREFLKKMKPGTNAIVSGTTLRRVQNIVAALNRIHNKREFICRDISSLGSDDIKIRVWRLAACKVKSLNPNRKGTKGVRYGSVKHNVMLVLLKYGSCTKKDVFEKLDQVIPSSNLKGTIAATLSNKEHKNTIIMGPDSIHRYCLTEEGRRMTVAKEELLQADKCAKLKNG